MKWKWKKLAALVLILLLIAQGLDILYVKRSTCRLPVLMYHHFVEDTDEKLADTTVSVSRFREQMTALKDSGFTAVTLGDVLDYVDSGVPLPDKPVLITMDDGYTSNLELAAPILEELGMCATVFVIGINEGEAIYVHSGNPLLPPRFSYEEAAPWVEKGVLDLQSHTYDMHQLASYGYSGRDGLLRLPGEDDDAYRAALEVDLSLFQARREGRVSTDLVALAYPFGYYGDGLDGPLAASGIRMTFTIEERENLLRRGDPDCLWRLGRYNVTNDWAGWQLAARLDQRY